MSRIIAGSAKGRTIKVPQHGTRPTSDKIREALFSRLEHMDVLEGARVLDLYAGSGALALEALSRGAASAVLVEVAKAAAGVCRQNIVALGFADRAQVVAVQVERFTNRSGAGSFDLIFCDPPYDVPAAQLEKVVQQLASTGLVAPGATLIFERAKRAATIVWPHSWELEDERRYGDTTIYVLTAE